MSRTKLHLETITGTSPSSATTSAIATVAGLLKYDAFTVDALLVGATGGTLDVTLQRKIDGVDLWVDWIHFAQLAAAASAVKYTVSPALTNTITTVGQSTTASPAAATLTAGTCVGGHPGDQIRCIATGGAGTSAGAAITIYITCWQSPL